jgi:hypothetical protein
MPISKVLIRGIAKSGRSHLAEYTTKSHPEVEIHGLAYSRSTRLNLESLRGKVIRHELEARHRPLNTDSYFN